jgi:hypothetical protein
MQKLKNRGIHRGFFISVYGGLCQMTIFTSRGTPAESR